ncbi:MAG: M43 family zinc metalloprotease [Bacteroidota bacterium]|nr:M43 family zinc metalloprotease [Bacteroidota bacterium]
MRHTILSLLIIFMFFSLDISAQEQPFKCATPEMNLKYLENHPKARAERARLAEFVENYIKSNPREDQIYIIPIVFHIVHNYGAENISYEQVADEVRIMTEDFRLMNPDTSQIIDEFKSIAGDAQIEFRLAKKDPWGNCSNGITRTQSYETSNGGEHIKDIAPSWPRAQYLNIWVVRSIPGGVAGYAYYPGTAGDGRDGILITHSYVGSIGTGSVGRSRTLTHEIGHYLNLAHPWGSTNDPEIPSNCDIDDGIDDTPNTIGNTSCNLYHVSCGSLDNVQNYMDYAYCSKMFTSGQGTMMRAALNSSASERNQLWKESNLIATGVLNPETAEICAPIADFSYDISSGCEGMLVNYTDLTYQTDSISSYSWQFEGGTPANSLEKNPSVNYQQTGIYNVSLTVTNPTDNSEKTVTQAIRVYPLESGFSLPYYDDLESEDFPIIADFESADYYYIKGGEIGWQYTDDAAYSGQHALMIDPRYEPYNISNSVVTPAIVVDSTDFPIKLHFKMSYSQKQTNNTDVLKIYASQNCGESWAIQYYKSGNSLHTANNYNSFSTFIPENTEWQDEEFPISETLFEHAENLRFRFDFLSTNGNRMYIDDIAVNTYNSIASNKLSDEFNVFPNPMDEKLMLNSEHLGTLHLELYDITGRFINQLTIEHGGMSDISHLIPKENNGLFMLKIITNSGTAVKRIVK